MRNEAATPLLILAKFAILGSETVISFLISTIFVNLGSEMLKPTSVDVCACYSSLYRLYKFKAEIPEVRILKFGLIKPMLIKNVDNLGVHE